MDPDVVIAYQNRWDNSINDIIPRSAVILFTEHTVNRRTLWTGQFTLVNSLNPALGLSRLLSFVPSNGFFYIFSHTWLIEIKV